MAMGISLILSLDMLEAYWRAYRD